MLTIDHLLWAVPNLEQGIAFFEQLTGIRAAEGGSHPGRGTRNALLSFGDGRYIELIGPDPAQDVDSLPESMGAAIKARTSAGLITFAIGCTDLDGLAVKVKSLGLPLQGPVDSSRKQPDGTTIHWRLSHTNGSEFGRYLPFYIDWLDTAHPSKNVPGGVQLLDFEVTHPKSDELAGLYAALQVDVRVRRGDRAGMRAVIRGAKGEVVLTSLSDDPS